jgi:NAD+ synthase (glutamine-hydrolysing)
MIALGLTTVYQATSNSGPVTRKAAFSLANAIGATHYEVDIQSIVSQYTSIFEQATGKSLDWTADDLTLQNIQARARSPMAWMFANSESKLLLATCNRSEAATGYMTMDGDTSGGLAPIAGVDKHFLRDWLCWAELENPLGLGPIPALREINCQVPTAELRPVGMEGKAQTDEADLMPYEMITILENLWLRQRLDRLSILSRIRSEYPIYAADAESYLEKFLGLWSKNQWKRERLAPSFHLDSFNVDPRSWCRYPILSK